MGLAPMLVLLVQNARMALKVAPTVAIYCQRARWVLTGNAQDLHNSETLRRVYLGDGLEQT